MRVLGKVKRDFWEDIAENCSYATFFHTPLWSDLMAKTFSCTDRTKGFVFDDSTRVVFPLMQGKGKFLGSFLNDYVSGYPYVYGGPIADRELSQEQYSEIIEYIKAVLRKHYRILIRGNPYTNNFKAGDLQEVMDISHVVELFNCEKEEDLFKSYGKRYRRYIRKAIKSNELIVKEVTTIDEYEKLYNIYRKTTKYWEKDLTRYPRDLFRNIYGMKSKHIKLWAVYYDDTMIGGDVNLYWKNICCVWLSYHDREYSELRAKRYMLHNIFLDCKERGISYYDFLQSGGIRGVEELKRSMGGKEYPHSAMLKENFFVTIAKKVRGLKKKF